MDFYGEDYETHFLERSCTSLYVDRSSPVPQRGRSNSVPTLPSMNHLKVTWDGVRPPSSIHQVWDFLSQKLRDTKERFRFAMEEYYGKQERMAYVSALSEALKVACDCGKNCQNVSNYLDLEELLKISPNATIRPRQLEKAQETIKSFMDKTRIIVVKLTEAKQNVLEEILGPLKKYCSSYAKLGIADDSFFKSLKSRTVSVKGILENFDKVSLSIRQSSPIEFECFSDKDFSQEVALAFDCETYSVLRVVPDLIQKVEAVFDIAQDWLRSDRVYLEQIQGEIGKVGERIKEAEFKSQMLKLEYDRMFSLLKQKQAEFDETDESFDLLWKSMSKLDAAKTKIEMEISAVGRTLRNCRDQLRDLTMIEHTISKEDGVSEDSDMDEVDCAAPDDDFHHEMARGGHAHSSYKSRLCRDARAYSTKIDYLRKKKKRIEKKIEHKKSMIHELEENENEIQQLSKKLRAIGKKKTKLNDELIALKSQQDVLRHTLDARLHPGSSAKASNKPPRVPGKKSHGRQNRKPTGSAGRTRTRHSAELHKAFRMVKNSIGHNWKDLVRVLPYSPAKQQSEINNEIRVIEYENQGQLKEQAYQAMVQWHNHNGRRASIDVLKDGLREIQENRLADHLEKMAVIRQESLSAGSGSGA